MTTPLRVGVVGFGWMGQVHARAWARLAHHRPDLDVTPIFVAVADNAEDDRTARAAAAFGFEHQLGHWQELVSRDDIDVVSVTGPNFIHAEVAIAVARSGKHLWIEKPAGRNSAETRSIAAAVHAAAVQSAAGFNYRNPPAVEVARDLVASGRIGRVEHSTVRFSSDYSAHPDGALSWRFVNEQAGSGVLGDLVSHAADLLRHVVAEPVDVVAQTDTFIAERPQADGAVSHFARGGDGPRGRVENEDYVQALLRLADGSRAMLESSRVEVGSQNEYRIDVHGTTGAISWDFRRMGELRVCLDQDYQNAGWATRFVGPGDGEYGVFQPGAANSMGYDDLKVIEAARLAESILTGKPVGATIDDAVAAAQIVDAISESAATRKWVNLT